MPIKTITDLEPDKLGTALMVSLKRALLVLALPATEFVILRVITKALGLKLGWRYFTDFDFIFPLPIAIAIALFVLEQAAPVKMGFRAKAFIFNLVSVASFLLSVCFFETIAVFSPALAATAFSMGGLLVVITAIRSMVSLKQIAANPNRWVFLPALLIASSALFGTLFFQSFWPYFSALASAGSCYLLDGTLGNVDCFTTAIHGARMIIRHPALTIAVGQGCGGMDGFFLFFFLILILILVMPKIFTRQQWAIVALGGIPVLFAINVIRICSFFGFAIVSKDILGSQAAVDVMLAFFHTHAGWAFFCLGIIGYVRAMQTLFSAAPAPVLSTVVES